MGVFLLLALIWVVVLVPPALRSHAARQEAFLASMGSGSGPSLDEPLHPSVIRSLRVQCRRRIAGGLLIAMGATLLVGLLPTFRTLLIVHLFLLDSFIAYIALLAHRANQAVRAPAPAGTVAPNPEPVRRGWGARGRVPAPAGLPELAPLT
ncbi:MAG TPA: hypothetical protein VM388_10590 [Acidimicrobiales bacterium]|nr:hypothetical protein [Acidimicrobiales bacterium]HWI05671.1 hypothetical protein [Acidimicrobiales bacterium]